jgi:MFS family permease
VRLQLGIPRSLVPVFWGLLFLEATYGAYLGIWPLWIEHLDAPITVVGLILGSAGVIRLIVLAPSAAIADRLGPRRAILIGRAATVIGLLSAAFATHWTHLAPMLIGAAMGEIAFPILQSLVAHQAGDQRMRSFAIIFSVGPSIALFVSPLLSGAVVALWGMRAAFVLAAACTAISLYFLARIQAPTTPTHREARPKSSYRDAFADPATRMIAFLLLVTIYSLSLGTAFVPTFLEDVRGMDPAVITTIGAAAAVGSASFGIAVARVRGLQRNPFAAVAVAVALTAVGLVLYRNAIAVPLLTLAFFFRGGLFSSWAMLSAAVGEFAPAQHRARAFALCEMVGGFAISLGPVVAAPLYNRRPPLPFEVAIVLTLLLIPTLLLAQRRARRLSTSSATSLLESVEPEPASQP